MLEVKSWVGGQRSVQLFRGGECLDLVKVAGEFECAPQEAVAGLLRKLEECGVQIPGKEEGAA